jgi:hypothetical protein
MWHMGETRNAYTTFVGKLERKRSLGNSQHRERITLRLVINKYGTRV